MSVPPGSTIGILGGGQLGRMTAVAARELGYHLRVLDPDASCASRFVVEELITASFDDTLAAEWLAHKCDVVTLEIEKVALASLDAAAKHAPVRPGRGVLAVVQDRIVQKTWLSSHGLPTGPFRVARSETELTNAIGELDGDCFVKAAHGGYDGRGQYETSSAADASKAWAELGSPAGVLVEKALPIEKEISVLVARRPGGEFAVYRPALNHHEARILAWSVLPAPIEPAIEARALELGRAIALELDVEGLLVIEMFIVGGEVLVNELAPRPHNSFHTTMVGAATSQFEQHVRAICDLPLGSTQIVRPAAIANLLGDLWVGEQTPDFDEALALPGVRLHLYGKRVARPGRKMGHLSATADSAEAAIELVQRASALLAKG
jgi:5-(carboxyamino)imidazole ribonucleotide synthase